MNPADRLYQKRLVLRAAIEFLMQPGPDGRRNDHRQHRVERQRAHHDQREDGTVDPHDGQKHDGEEQVQHHRHGMARQELADMLQLPHPRHGVPHPTRLKVRQRERQDMAEQLRAQPDINPIRRM